MDEESIKSQMSLIGSLSIQQEEALISDSKRLKRRILEVAAKKGGHFGGSFSCIDVLLYLYKNVLKRHESDPDWELRDRFIMSKGHSVLALYAILEDLKLIRDNELETYLEFESRLAGHAEHFHIPWIEMSTGSLGHGTNSGCGIALGARLKGQEFKVFVLVGDGELNEGSNWEAFLFATQHNLSNFVLLVDNNGLESLDRTSEILGIEPLEMKLKSFGFSVFACNGHSFKEMAGVFSAINEAKDHKPKAIILDTQKGHGVSFMNGNPMWHYRELAEAELEIAMSELKQ
jgi:transketolase